MIIDCNAWLGHYPFRAVPDNTADALLRLMDRHGIDKAVVSSLHSVFYSDAHSGNSELAQWVRPHRDRLIASATLNPMFPGWEQDLKQCVDEWEMRGVRLFPSHHRFALTSPKCVELVHSASELGQHLAIPLRLEDRRQQHWMDTAPEVQLGEVAALSRCCPAARLLVLEAIGVESSPFVGDVSLAEARVYFEISRMASVLQQTIPALLGLIGPQRLLFGTGMPLKIPGAAKLKLELLEAPEEIKARLAHGSAEQLLSPLSDRR